MDGASNHHSFRDAGAKVSAMRQRSIEMYASDIAVLRSDPRLRQMYQHLIMRPTEEGYVKIPGPAYNCILNVFSARITVTDARYLRTKTAEQVIENVLVEMEIWQYRVRSGRAKRLA